MLLPWFQFEMFTKCCQLIIYAMVELYPHLLWGLKWRWFLHLESLHRSGIHTNLAKTELRFITISVQLFHHNRCTLVWRINSWATHFIILKQQHNSCSLWTKSLTIYLHLIEFSTVTKYISNVIYPESYLLVLFPLILFVCHVWYFSKFYVEIFLTNSKISQRCTD